MGYKNPEKVTDYSQKVKTSEWTIFLKTKNTSLSPFISQFIHSVDFLVPKQNINTVLAPQKSKNFTSDGVAANYSIIKKINKNLFKLDNENKKIVVDITIWTTKKLETKKALAKPFAFIYELDFNTKEQC